MPFAPWAGSQAAPTAAGARGRHGPFVAPAALCSSAQGPACACPAKSCPATMVYLESGSPCMDTCSHLEVSSLCEEHRMDGCFCPEGEC